MSRLISVQLKPKDGFTEPVSLQEAKDWMRIDFSDDDSVITSQITASRQKCEKYLGLCLVETEVKALYKNSGGDLIELAYGPIETDGDGLPVIDGIPDGAEIKGFGNQIWISSTDGELTLSYTSKFDPIPDWAKDAILNDVAYFYENRGDMDIKYVAQVNQPIAPQTMAILYPHRTTLHEFFL